MTTARLLPTLFLAALLVAAQGVLVLHAFEHDPGAPPGKICAMCVTANQLAAGSLDTHVGEAPEPVRHTFTPAVSREAESVHTPAVRQRGPPSDD